MMFIELFAPSGALSAQQRQRIGEDLIADFMRDEYGADSLVQGARACSQVVVHEPETWVAGGRGADVATQPRYLVRITVPGSWRKEMSEMLIASATRVLAAHTDEGDRLYTEPHAWVQVVGIPEHSYGAFGRVMTSTDITRLITADYRDSPESRAAAAAVPEGMGIDPVCGMTAQLSEAGITLEHDGTTYAFCSVQCRTVYAEDHGVAFA